MAVKPGSKYYPLFEHLRRIEKESITLTFGEIEQILGETLPASARARRAFWSNRGGDALQASAWMESGFHVLEVDTTEERVVFTRPISTYTIRREGEEVRWDALMIKALRAYLGVNQVGLAKMLGVRQQTVSEWETNVYAPTRARSNHLTLVAEKAGFPFAEDD